MKEACKELWSSRKGVLRELREGLPDRGLWGRRAGRVGCSQTPERARAAERRAEGRMPSRESTASGRGVTLARLAGRAMLGTLHFSLKKRELSPRSNIICILHVIWGCSKCERGDILGAIEIRMAQ